MSQSWDQIILPRSTDEKAAFDTFFQLLTEFRQRNPIQLTTNTAYQSSTLS